VTALDQFQALATPTTPESFRIGPTISPGCLLCKSSAGQLAILVRASPTGGSSPRRLQKLHYTPPRALRVIDDEHQRIESFATIVCCTDETALRAAFLRVVELVLWSSAERTEDELETSIDELVDLFQTLSRPGSSTVQGLWAELALILWSSEPQHAVSSWRSRPGATHDFESNQDKLEVKSAVTGLREHNISLDQLAELPGGRTLLASFLLEEAEDGASVGDLVDAICARMPNASEVERRIRRITMRTLGSEWKRSAINRYSLRGAEESVRFYEASHIPAPARPTPVEVKHVRFVVDLSSTEPLELQRARAMSSFFNALLPRGRAGAVNLRPAVGASAREVLE
jgi:hypothetical protein